jgi:hypothetical protein
VPSRHREKYQVVNLSGSNPTLLGSKVVDVFPRCLKWTQERESVAEVTEQLKWSSEVDPR